MIRLFLLVLTVFTFSVGADEQPHIDVTKKASGADFSLDYPTTLTKQQICRKMEYSTRPYSFIFSAWYSPKIVKTQPLFAVIENEASSASPTLTVGSLEGTIVLNVGAETYEGEIDAKDSNGDPVRVEATVATDWFSISVMIEVRNDATHTTTISVYLNGAKVYFPEVSSDFPLPIDYILETTSFACFGTDFLGERFFGQIDEVYMFKDTALLDTDFFDFHANGFYPKETLNQGEDCNPSDDNNTNGVIDAYEENLLAYLRFSECSSETVAELKNHLKYFFDSSVNSDVQLDGDFLVSKDNEEFSCSRSTLPREANGKVLNSRVNLGPSSTTIVMFTVYNNVSPLKTYDVTIQITSSYDASEVAFYLAEYSAGNWICPTADEIAAGSVTKITDSAVPTEVNPSRALSVEDADYPFGLSLCAITTNKFLNEVTVKVIVYDTYNGDGNMGNIVNREISTTFFVNHSPSQNSFTFALTFSGIGTVYAIRYDYTTKAFFSVDVDFDKISAYVEAFDSKYLSIYKESARHESYVVGGTTEAGTYKPGEKIVNVNNQIFINLKTITTDEVTETGITIKLSDGYSNSTFLITVQFLNAIQLNTLRTYPTPEGNPLLVPIHRTRSDADLEPRQLFFTSMPVSETEGDVYHYLGNCDEEFNPDKIGKTLRSSSVNSAVVIKQYPTNARVATYTDAGKFDPLSSSVVWDPDWEETDCSKIDEEHSPCQIIGPPDAYLLSYGMHDQNWIGDSNAENYVVEVYFEKEAIPSSLRTFTSYSSGNIVKITDYVDEKVEDDEGNVTVNTRIVTLFEKLYSKPKQNISPSYTDYDLTPNAMPFPTKHITLYFQATNHLPSSLDSVLFTGYYPAPQSQTDRLCVAFVPKEYYHGQTNLTYVLNVPFEKAEKVIPAPVPTGYIQFDVTSVNDIPTITDWVMMWTVSDVTPSIQVTIPATDIETVKEELKFKISELPKYGTLTIETDKTVIETEKTYNVKTLIYTPNCVEDQVLEEKLRFQISDPDGGVSDPETGLLTLTTRCPESNSMAFSAFVNVGLPIITSFAGAAVGLFFGMRLYQ